MIRDVCKVFFGETLLRFRSFRTISVKVQRLEQTYKEIRRLENMWESSVIVKLYQVARALGRTSCHSSVHAAGSRYHKTS